MKEYLRKAALAVFLVLTLSGCGGAGGAEPGASAQPPEAGTGSDRAVETIAAAPETEPERPEVENNGGFFVRVGDRVWFRYYGEDAMDELTVIKDEFIAKAKRVLVVRKNLIGGNKEVIKLLESFAKEIIKELKCGKEKQK